MHVRQLTDTVCAVQKSPCGYTKKRTVSPKLKGKGAFGSVYLCRLFSVGCRRGNGGVLVPRANRHLEAVILGNERELRASGRKFRSDQATEQSPTPTTTPRRRRHRRGQGRSQPLHHRVCRDLAAKVLGCLGGWSGKIVSPLKGAVAGYRPYTSTAVACASTATRRWPYSSNVDRVDSQSIQAV